MMTFTYIAIIIFLIGIILTQLPVNWYRNSCWNFHMIGAWIASITASIYALFWLFHFIYTLCVGLFNLLAPIVGA